VLGRGDEDGDNENSGRLMIIRAGREKTDTRKVIRHEKGSPVKFGSPRRKKKNQRGRRLVANDGAKTHGGSLGKTGRRKKSTALDRREFRDQEDPTLKKI